ncbi:hypothetical protein GCM10017557_13970 [Streptomyces aurantiacus]|uniref:Uncharacterized protein n=1 Tax=Streptomyces aurantiacus TaxID=47760 RepID=A0A7G1NTT0_9ACTN|nr:hypothetical protein GCM10017557_13970 [Streptomyces aurantiacus]
MRSAADIEEVGCPEPAAAAARTLSTRSCCPSSVRGVFMVFLPREVRGSGIRNRDGDGQWHWDWARDRAFRVPLAGVPKRRAPGRPRFAPGPGDTRRTALTVPSVPSRR